MVESAIWFDKSTVLALLFNSVYKFVTSEISIGRDADTDSRYCIACIHLHNND